VQYVSLTIFVPRVHPVASVYVAITGLTEINRNHQAIFQNLAVCSNIAQLHTQLRTKVCDRRVKTIGDDKSVVIDGQGVETDSLS
jgi:hypothetical protein